MYYFTKEMTISSCFLLIFPLSGRLVLMNNIALDIDVSLKRTNAGWYIHLSNTETLPH